MQELRGKIIADQIKGECLDFVGQYNGILPALAILRVGHKEAYLSYERRVKKRFLDFGLEAKDYELPENVSNEEFQQVFDFINQDPEIHGILVMRPLPKQIDEAAMLRKMNPLKDLDGITDTNVAGVMRGDADAFAPCTAQARGDPEGPSDRDSRQGGLHHRPLHGGREAAQHAAAPGECDRDCLPQ